MTNAEAFYRFYPTYMRVDIDPAFPMMREIFRRYKLSYEQQLWNTFLYTVFYHIGSVFLVSQEFPDYEKVNLPRLFRWFRKFDNNERRSLFQKDRIRHALPCGGNPGKYQFERLVESYFQVVGASQKNFIEGVTTASDMLKRICTVNGIGRHAGLAYVETLIRCVGVKLEPDTYANIAGNESHQGFAYFAGKDAVSPNEAAEIVGELMPKLAAAYPDIPVDAMWMETVGCAFRKLVEGRLYLGYYLDRQADEINTTSALPLACGAHWETLWQMREEIFPTEYLNRSGLRKELLARYKRTSEIE
jgi:hypothetical protein